MGSEVAVAARPVQIFTTPEAIKQYAQQLQPRKLWYRIDPRTSRRLQCWDALTTLALLFTALVTPYEVSLLQAKLDGLFYVNRVVDMIFAIDVFVNFVTMKQRSSGTLSQLSTYSPSRPTKVRSNA